MSASSADPVAPPERVSGVVPKRVVIATRLGDLRVRIRPAPPKQPSKKVVRRWLDWDCGHALCSERERRPVAPACAQRVATRSAAEEATAARGLPARDPIQQFDRQHDLLLDCIDRAPRVREYLEGKGARVNEGPYVRPSRAKQDPTPKPRVLAPLTKDEERVALDALQKRPIRKGVDRAEWLSEVFIELLNPPADAEPTLSFDERITRAVWRAEKKQQRQQQKSAAFCPSSYEE